MSPMDAEPLLNSRELVNALVGFFGVIVAYQALKALFFALFHTVEDETACLVTRFGKLVHMVRNPGLHWMPFQHVPGYEVFSVSLQRDYREYQGIHVNDCKGTSVVIDLWIEFRIAHPKRALFEVEDWEAALQGLVTHSATSILGTQEFKQILTDRTELSQRLQSDIAPDTSRWGLEIERVLIREVQLLPEVSRQMFRTAAARLEISKAAIEEEGRLSVELLEAKTENAVAELEAQAKAQYPIAMSRVFGALSMRPRLKSAYELLYKLSLVRPHRTVVFEGFGPEEIKPADAAMMLAPSGPTENVG